MGALQAYHWAALFPDAVERIVVNCGVARTAVHNQVFLRSLMATLEAAPSTSATAAFPRNPRPQSVRSGAFTPPGASARTSIAPGLHLGRRPSRTWARPTWTPS